MNEFEKCLKNRRIVAIEPTPEMLQKEMENAKYDLSKAEDEGSPTLKGGVSLLVSQ